MPEELLGLQALGEWDGLHIFPDAQPAPDRHWQVPRICAGWESEGQWYVRGTAVLLP